MMEVMKQHHLKLTPTMPPTTPTIGKSSPIRSQEDQVHSITAGLIQPSSFPRLDTFTLWVIGGNTINTKTKFWDEAWMITYPNKKKN